MFCKIHRNAKNAPGRPVASCTETPHKRSQFLDHFISSMVPLLTSYLRDSTHLINILNLDLYTLCTKILHDEGMTTIKEILAIHRPPHDLPHSSYTLEILNNYWLRPFLT